MPHPEGSISSGARDRLTVRDLQVRMSSAAVNETLYPAYLEMLELTSVNRPTLQTAAQLEYSFSQMHRLIVAGFIGLTCAMVLSAQAPVPARPGPLAVPPVASAPADQKPVGADSTGLTSLTAATERDLLNRYCVSCHSERAKAAGMDSARTLALDA